MMTIEELLDLPPLGFMPKLPEPPQNYRFHCDGTVTVDASAQNLVSPSVAQAHPGLDPVVKNTSEALVSMELPDFVLAMAPSYLPELEPLPPPAQGTRVGTVLSRPAYEQSLVRPIISVFPGGSTISAASLTHPSFGLPVDARPADGEAPRAALLNVFPEQTQRLDVSTKGLPIESTGEAQFRTIHTSPVFPSGRRPVDTVPRGVPAFVRADYGGLPALSHLDAHPEYGVAPALRPPSEALVVLDLSWLETL